MFDLRSVRDLAHAVLDETTRHLFPGAAVTTLACIGPGKPHLADEGFLCNDPLQELATWLRDVEEEAIRLEVAPSLAVRWDAGGGSLASQRSPVELDALAYLDDRSSAHGYRHIGPVCNWCPTAAARRCTCPPLEWRRIVHWAPCPQYGIHPSCLAILGDRDEHESGAERLMSVLPVLNGWAQMVRDGRLMGITTRRVVDRIPGMIRPVCACSRCEQARWYRDIPVEPTITGERDVLSRHLRWIAAQDWVGDMRRELGDLRAQLQRANKNEPDKPLPGWCPWLVEGRECGGHLWPEKGPAYATGYDTDDAGLMTPRAIVCGLNPKHRWESAGDRARLSLIVEGQQRKDDAS